MRIEEVRIGSTVGVLAGHTVVGQYVQHVFDDLEGMVPVEHARPEVGLPAQAPARGHVATLAERVGSRREQIRVGVGRNLVRGVESVEVGDVPVLILRVVAVDEPLLQLAVTANLHRRQLL